MPNNTYDPSVHATASGTASDQASGAKIFILPQDQAQNGEVTIDLLALLRSVWKNFVYVILLAVIGGAAMFFYTSLFYVPTYETDIALYVNDASVSIGNANISISSLSSGVTAASKLVNTYTFVLDSRATLNEIIEVTGVPYDYKELGKMIRSESVEGTGGLKIYVKSSDPMEAELIANTIADVLSQRITDVIEGCSVKVVDYAFVPSSPEHANYVKNTLIGMIAGALLAAVIIAAVSFISDMKDKSVRSVDDFRAAYPNIPVLGMIPDMTVSGSKKGYYSNYYSSYESSVKKQPAAKKAAAAKNDREVK
jgi:capsular polysaccharide biosynthesis protein